MISLNQGLGRRRDYDVLRVLCMGAVVYLHTAAGTLRLPPNTALWHFSNWCGALGTAAVPLFFMLSGSLLLGSGKTADPAFMLKHRLPKIVVPGLCWSLLAIGLTGYRQGWRVAADQLLLLPNTAVVVAYWFLYALVPIYLLAPLLKRMTDHMQPVHWKYLLLLWVGLTLGLNTLSAFVPAPWNGLVRQNATLNVNLVEGYLGYFLLGAFLERLEKVPSKAVLWCVVLGDWAVIALGTWWDMARTGVYGERFLSYRGLFAMVLASGLFLLAKSYLRSGRPGGRLLGLLSSCSFGVYLAHPVFIQAAERLFLLVTGLPANRIWEQVAVWGMALISSVAAVVVLASIKPLCYPLTGQKFSDACRESNLAAILGGKRD